MVQELKERMAWLKKTERGHEDIMNMINATLKHIEGFINSNPFDYARNEESYACFNESLNNFYNNTLELTHKIHWFGQVRHQLTT